LRRSFFYVFFFFLPPRSCTIPDVTSSFPSFLSLNPLGRHAFKDLFFPLTFRDEVRVFSPLSEATRKSAPLPLPVLHPIKLRRCSRSVDRFWVLGFPPSCEGSFPFLFLRMRGNVRPPPLLFTSFLEKNCAASLRDRIRALALFL